MPLLLLFAVLPSMTLDCGVVDQSDDGHCVVERFGGGLVELSVEAPEGAVLCLGLRAPHRTIHARPRAVPVRRTPRGALPLHATLEELSR